MYAVIELQKLDANTLAIPPAAQFNTFEEAAGRYHAILSVAATSSVPVHSCFIVDENGQQLKVESYRHMAETV